MSRSFIPSASDLKALVSLAVPMVVVQVGLMAMGVVDTIFVGHVSATELAATALGNLYFFGIAILGMGTIMALDPIVSQAVGARDRDAIARAMQRGVVLAGVIAVPATLLCLPAEPWFTLFRQPPEVIPRATAFVHVSAPGMLPFFAWVVLRQSLQAMKHMRPIVLTIVVANLVNAALNWVFVFGNLGMPPMGAVGAALSSMIGRVFMLLMLLGLGWRDLRPHLVPFHGEAFALAPLGRMLALGFPIGVQFILEFGAFAMIALLAGWFGTDAMAGHQVAINLASLTFMVPLGVSSAASVLVGQAIGQGDPPHARRVAATALACGAAFMALCAVTFLAVPELFARIYTSVPNVIVMASALIPIAGVFQVFDGIQVVASGVLRGVGDTRAPMIVYVLAFWLIGMPVSLFLGIRMNGGVVGLWWGFVAGLAAVALFLLLRVRARLSRSLERVRIENQPATIEA